MQGHRNNDMWVLEGQKGASGKHRPLPIFRMVGKGGKQTTSTLEFKSLVQSSFFASKWKAGTKTGPGIIQIWIKTGLDYCGPVLSVLVQSRTDNDWTGLLVWCHVVCNDICFTYKV